MSVNTKANAFILGIFLFLGLASLGFLLNNGLIKFKEFERTVTAKGLSEREVDADIVIWPIEFTQASNDLTSLYNSIESNTLEISKFLTNKGIDSSEISFSTPSITDKSAQQYVNNGNVEFRYTAIQTVTVYSKNVKAVRETMSTLSELGKKGIVFTGNNYNSETEYIFTRLNDVKPEMIEEATRNAR